MIHQTHAIQAKILAATTYSEGPESKPTPKVFPGKAIKVGGAKPRELSAQYTKQYDKISMIDENKQESGSIVDLFNAMGITVKTPSGGTAAVYKAPVIQAVAKTKDDCLKLIAQAEEKVQQINLTDKKAEEKLKKDLTANINNQKEALARVSQYAGPQIYEAIGIHIKQILKKIQ